MIHALVEHKVAVTSTLVVFEASIPGRPPLEERVLQAMSPEAAVSYLTAKERAAENPNGRTYARLKKEMDFEREFAAAGGLLMAGCDPTGNGGALPGFGDQRNLELLVEAGFKPEEAIRIYTYNGALYLGQADKIGSIAPGKQADLVVVEGDPSTRIADVEKVKYVFKEGVAFDPAKLIARCEARSEFTDTYCSYVVPEVKHFCHRTCLCICRGTANGPGFETAGTSAFVFRGFDFSRWQVAHVGRCACRQQRTYRSVFARVEELVREASAPHGGKRQGLLR